MGYQKGELVGKELTEVPANEKKADFLDTINSCIKFEKVGMGLVFVQQGYSEWFAIVSFLWPRESDWPKAPPAGFGPKVGLELPISYF